MRAKQLVFHVSCFRCEICNVTLTKGDQYGIRNSSVLCRLHYEKPLEESSSNYPYTNPQFSNSFTNNVVAVSNEEPKMFSNFFDQQQIEVTQPPRQKGRPRKRKNKDVERMTANLGKLLRFLHNHIYFIFFNVHTYIFLCIRITLYLCSIFYLYMVIKSFSFIV